MLRNALTSGFAVCTTLGALAFAPCASAQTAEAPSSVPEVDSSRPPTPEEDAQARVHFQSGQMFFQQGRFEEAARAFEEAYRLSHRPELLLNASTSYERMLRLEHALQLARACVARLPAEHPRRSECEVASRRLDTMATQQRNERDATRRREEEARAAREQAERDRAEAERLHREAMAARDADDDGSSGLTTLQWVGIGTASAGLGLGIWGGVTGYHARTARDALDTVCVEPSACPDAPTVRDTISLMKRRATLSTVGIIAGGASLAAGVVLIFVGGSDEEEAGATVTAGPGDVGLGFALRY